MGATKCVPSTQVVFIAGSITWKVYPRGPVKYGLYKQVVFMQVFFRAGLTVHGYVMSLWSISLPFTAARGVIIIRHVVIIDCPSEIVRFVLLLPLGRCSTQTS